MSIDTERFRSLLLEERGRVERALANLRDDHPGRLDEEVEEIAATQDNHLAETATATLDREIDYMLEQNSTRMLAAIHVSSLLAPAPVSSAASQRAIAAASCSARPSARAPS